ncbi:hemerythrin domain-containing protein [Rhodococcus koreensis]|uniref:hemerythrin domain-containing protein n=1 Tax=Rhodococcus koreensis TaxID=99653 RepID=UPI0036D8C030
MKPDPNGPADTRVMVILHDALRRDLARTRRVLTAPGPPADTRRVAIAEHVIWMMEYLRFHHHAEDEFLWPLIRRLNPGAGALLDRMDADHARITPEIDRLITAAGTYRADDSAEAREAVVAALDGLEGALLPHLRREEDEMMPVVSRTITRRQWDDWGHDIVKNKPKVELAREVPWVIDGLDPDRYQLVAHVLPPVPRMILLHALAGSYRRASATRWGPQVAATPLTSTRRERRHV